MFVCFLLLFFFLFIFYFFIFYFFLFIFFFVLFCFLFFFFFTRYLLVCNICNLSDTPKSRKLDTDIRNKKKGKRKVQGVPQSQTAALPRHKEEEKTDKSKQAQIEQTYEKLED